jgi:AcrR family transcriptional regulator
MPKISPEAARDRRANIVSAAKRCFMRDGIHISVDDICAEAGVSKGALYGYFKSKEEVIQAIADEHVADFARVRDAKTPTELVAALFERLSCGDRAANRLELEAWTYSLSRPDLRSRLSENTIALRSAIEVAFARMTGGGDRASRDGALIVETVALGLVATAALDRGDDVKNILTLVVAEVARPSD